MSIRFSISNGHVSWFVDWIIRVMYLWCLFHPCVFNPAGFFTLFSNVFVCVFGLLLSVSKIKRHESLIFLGVNETCSSEFWMTLFHVVNYDWHRFLASRGTNWYGHVYKYGSYSNLNLFLNIPVDLLCSRYFEEAFKGSLNENAPLFPTSSR